MVESREEETSARKFGLMWVSAACRPAREHWGGGGTAKMKTTNVTKNGDSLSLEIHTQNDLRYKQMTVWAKWGKKKKN